MSSSSSSSSSINALLKKTEHYDKDERYMATSDLCELLKRPISSSSSGMKSSKAFDSVTERSICTAVLRLLHDKSNDVQAIAVKTLSVLLQTVPQELVLEIADSLADQVLDAGKSKLRDVYSIGLRTLVKTIPTSMGDSTSNRLITRLLDGIRNSTPSLTPTSAPSAAAGKKKKGKGKKNAPIAIDIDEESDEEEENDVEIAAAKEREEIVLSCLDVLTDLLGRFGATSVAVTRQHEPVLQICLTLISGGSSTTTKSKSTKSKNKTSPVVRKRAGNALGCLSVVLSDALLVSAVERLLSQIEDNNNDSSHNNTENTRALIRTMCTISGAVGHRLQQPQIDRIIPIFLTFTDPENALTGDDEDNIDEEDNEDAMQDNNDNISQDEEQDEAAVHMADELRESCFMGFESFVTKCPTQVEPHLDRIVQAALAYMSYDPNYSYGSDEEKGDGDGMDEDGSEDNSYDDDDEYGDDDDDDDYDDDDDDESWKVRRSAIRALLAVVETKKHDPGFLWSKQYAVRKRSKSVECVALALVQRFKEREENCRVGILETFTKLLAVTTQEISSETTNLKFSSITVENDSDDTTMDTDGDGEGEGNNNTDDVIVIDLYGKYAPALVKGCEKLLGMKKVGERSKSHVLSLLSTLCLAPGGVGGKEEILSVFTHVQTFLGGGDDDAEDNTPSTTTTSKALRLDALSLIVAMLESNNHHPEHIREGLSSALLPQLCAATQEQWYKVIAEALRALAAVPKFFGSGGGNKKKTKKNQETTNVANRLYTSIEPLLAAHDVDQEIKECALLATSSLLSELHPSLLKKQTTRLSVLLLERLKNETTRIPALRTLSAICSSPQGTEIDFAGPKGNQGILKPALEVMAGFLQMQSRSLRQTALEALDVVIQHHGSTIKPKQLATDLYSSLLQELAELVVDTDLHISHLSLRASISALKVCPDAGPSVKDHLLPRVLVLSSSPLLQDLALESLLAHLEQVVISNAVDFQELLEMLRGRLEKAAESKHAIYNLAQCIAVITSVTTPENQQGVVTEFLQTLDGSVTPSSEGEEIELRKVQLALLVSGDLGRMVDLGTIIMDDVKDDDTNVPSKLTTIYMGYFDSPSEDLTNASSYALGRAAVGDTQSIFLQAIVNSLDDDNNEKQQYLLLSALRGFIQSSYAQSGGEGIASNLPLILPHVINHASDEKEGVRSMAAECLGSLTCMQPAIMCEKLCTLAEEHSAITVTEKGTVEKGDTTSQKNAFVCWTVAISFKHAIAGKADPAQLTQSVPKLLTLLLDQKELGARNATLLMVYSAVHHMPQLVSGSIMKEQITPALYEVAAFKLERKIDLGPFSHKVDDALPLRKAALSIFATSLENLPGSFDIGPFLPVLKLTLKDVEDIQLQAHQIVIAMCARPHTTSYMVAAAEDFVEPLEKTMHRKVGTKTGTELERLIDWKKSALRTMVALSKVEGTMNSRKFADFVERISANSKFRAALEAIKEER